MNKHTFVMIILAAAVLPGCPYGPLDVLGNETVVTDESHNSTEPEDDRIEDKNPVCDPDRTVVETFQGCDIKLNKSCAVTRLDIAPLEEGDEDLADRIFPDRPAAAGYIQGRTDHETHHIPSMEVVNGAMKPFNDGLYAAIEIGVEEGLSDGDTEVYPSKRRFLGDLLAGLVALSEGATPAQCAHIDNAAADVAAALILAGEEPSAPAPVLADAADRAAAFDLMELYSKPIGFYTWNPTLGEIFTQDRYLQNYQVEYTLPGDPYSIAQVGKAASIAIALEADADLMDDYQGYLALYAGLTNPFMNFPVTALGEYVDGVASLDGLDSVRTAFLADHEPPPLLPECQPHFALFPSSTSKETAYFEEQFCVDGAPADVNYMDVLIAAIRDGLIDLEPDESSGWYDYQSYALETLLLPERGAESQNLLLTAAYKEKLMDTFRSILTQNRETHVKQLEIGMATMGSPDEPVDIYPNFPVEPFPTFYLRSARAYRFLGTYLEAVLGAGFLDMTHRLVEDGTESEMTLREELGAKAELLYGLHARAADSVGSPTELLEEELAQFPEVDCRARADEWLESWLSDDDVRRDPRVIVPVQRDADRGLTYYWAVVGVKVIKAHAEFVEGREPDVLGTVGESWCTIGEIVPHEYYLLVEAFAEIAMPMDAPPPTRDEFRAICDAHDNVEDIVTALEAP
ncbi:MAG: hypothetical protein JRG91_11070 [Deltaproteobacteria bacterium]|nr:hypothetical protein [Deltaproteobacteria bacterium]